jgi:catechol 2,3-dioxygenase-like lactoylglutathione lyase family enzyme
MLESASARATIAVTDVEQAKNFYGGTLGLRALDERTDGVRYASGDGWFLVYPSQFAGTNQSTAMTFEVDDLEATMRDLRDRGVTFEEYDLPGLKTVNGIVESESERGAWFKDPDGNIVALGELR